MHDEKDINIFNKDRIRLHPCIALLVSLQSWPLSQKTLFTSLGDHCSYQFLF